MALTQTLNAIQSNLSGILSTVQDHASTVLQTHKPSQWLCAELQKWVIGCRFEIGSKCLNLFYKIFNASEGPLEALQKNIFFLKVQKETRLQIFSPLNWSVLCHTRERHCTNTADRRSAGCTCRPSCLASAVKQIERFVSLTGLNVTDP